jgi:hypothetical protein
VTELEDDIFAESKRMREDWDEGEYRAQQLAGALLETVCPACQMLVGACKIDGPDDRWLEVECPACRHRWTEEV